MIDSIDLLIAVFTEQAYTRSIEWTCSDRDNPYKICAIFGDFLVYLEPIDSAKGCTIEMYTVHVPSGSRWVVQYEWAHTDKENTLRGIGSPKRIDSTNLFLSASDIISGRTDI